MTSRAVGPAAPDGQAHGEADIKLGPSTEDQVAAFVRTTSSLIPGVGPAIGQLIGEVIPNQRLERAEDYLRRLGERVQHLETIKDTPERVALFEDGALLAFRALREERKRHIANVVSRGLNGSEQDVLDARRLLSLLSQLDVDDILFLESKIHGRLQDALERHPNIVREPFVSQASGDEERERAILWRLRERTLIRLGLLQVKFRKPKRGEMPEFDETTGMIKAQGSKLTRLGLMLLRHLGLADEKSFSM